MAYKKYPSPSIHSINEHPFFLLCLVIKRQTPSPHPRPPSLHAQAMGGACGKPNEAQVVNNSDSPAVKPKENIQEIIMAQGYHDGIQKGEVGKDIELKLEALNPVQRRVVVALQTTRRKKEFEEVNFTKILLKFSKIRTTLQDVKAIFRAVDTDNDGFIDEKQVDTCLKKLKSNIEAEELSDFFEISAVSGSGGDGKKKLNEKEFLVALAICYVLRGIEELNTPAKRRTSIDARNDRGSHGLAGGIDPNDHAAQMALATKLNEEAQKNGSLPQSEDFDSCRSEGRSDFKAGPARKRKNSVTGLFTSRKNDTLKANFDLIVHAYLLFDQGGKGYIAKSDVSNMMKEEGAGEGQFFLQDERWSEMDWNSDGTIEFSEFVYTFSRWVDIDED